MTVFLCLDNKGGMMFNKRRQSRDAKVIEDIARVADDGLIYISDFSEILFEESSASVICVPNPLEAASANAFVFCEDSGISEFTEKIDRLIIYRWGEIYPSDMKLDINPESCGFRLKSTRKFKGKSHDNITREDYIK